MAGIYLIHNTRTGDRYIGGTATSFARRFASHRSALKGGYGVPLLQACWDAEKDPERWFRFIPVHKCAPGDVRRLEMDAIETLRPSLNAPAAPPFIAVAALAAGVSRQAIRYRIKVGNPLDTPKGLRDTIDGTSMTLREIAARFGLPLQLVQQRYAHGERHPTLTRPYGQRK